MEVDTVGPDGVERPPVDLAEVFGERTPQVRRYSEFLTEEGVTRGLLGPREPGRIWSRHLLNCAVVTPLFATGTRVVDLGAGAGLPGLVIALRRPDLRVDLIEPMRRRAVFLEEAVTLLGLDDQVRVLCGRAEDADVRGIAGNSPWITARAVAPLPRLMTWCQGLIALGGSVALLKGATARAELEDARRSLTAAGWRNLTVELHSLSVSDTESAVVTAMWRGADKSVPRRRGGAQSKRRFPAVPRRTQNREKS